MNPNNLYLPKGKLFYSHKEFTEWCEKLQANEHPTKLSGFDIKTITAAKLKRFMDPALIYYKFHKKCEFFGEFVSKRKTNRKTTSKKVNCPFFFYFRINQLGNALELIHCNWSHNHPPHVLTIAPEPNDIIQPTKTTVPETTEENPTNESNSDKLLHILDDIENYPFVYANDSIVFEDAIEIINELVPTVDRAIEKDGHTIVYRPCVEVNNEEIRSLAIGSVSEEAGRRATKIVNEGAKKLDVKNFDEIARSLEAIVDTTAEGSSGEIPQEEAGGFGVIIETRDRGSGDENPEKAAEHIKTTDDTTAKGSSDEITEEKISSKSVSVAVLSKIEANNSNDSKIVEISSIKIAQKKPRGRPKGKVLSAIGLPIRRVSKKKNENYDNSTLTAFINLNIKYQIEIIIKWVIKTHDIMATVIDKSHKITTTDIREELPDSLMDDEVNFHCVYEYFEKAAIQNLKQAINKKKKLGLYTCQICLKKVTSNSIRCDLCLTCFHKKCQDLTKSELKKKSQDNIDWFCSICIEASK